MEVQMAAVVALGLCERHRGDVAQADAGVGHHHVPEVGQRGEFGGGVNRVASSAIGDTPGRDRRAASLERAHQPREVHTVGRNAVGQQLHPHLAGRHAVEVDFRDALDPLQAPLYLAVEQLVGAAQAALR